MPLHAIERRVRIAAAFVSAGLLVELMALRWPHPVAFLVFALVGIPVAAAGTLVFLYSLVSVRE